MAKPKGCVVNSSSSKTNQRCLRTFGTASAALLAAALLPLDAIAQEGRSSNTPTATSAGPEEIIVTARRRDESLSSVPITITAIESDELIERSIRTDSDLQLAAPGLTIRQTQGNNSLTYSIRGQSADTFSGSPSAVIAYLNDVPLTIGSASSFYDLESVQVLKGPQGTLFGRNTTGGAVLYTTARPTDKMEALLRTRFGNLELRDVEAMLNVPISDTVLLRAAFDVIERDGYIDNLLNGDELGELSRKSGRLSLTITPSDALSNTTVFQYTDVGGTNTGASYTYSVYTPGQANNGFTLTSGAGFLFSPALDFFGAGSWNAYLAAHPNAYAPGLPAYVEEQRRIGPYKTRHPGRANHEGRDVNASNTTTFEINDNLTVKNILGASTSKTDSEQPQLGAPFVTILTANINTGKSGNELEVESYSDELQLQGEGLNGELTYIAGYYFQRMKSDTLWPQTYFDVSPIILPVTATNNFRIRNETDAIYTQGTYDLGSLTGVENLRVTAGVRYTWERVSIEQLREGDAFALFGPVTQSKSFKDPSWELGVEYQATPSMFTYLKTRGSFRSGGFNGSADPVNATATGGGNIFDSEHTQDIEAGLKYRGEVGGRPATFNLAAYYQWIEDVQRVEFPDPDGPGGRASIAVTANVPEAEVHGVEFEASILATSWLELGLSGTFTEAEFTDGDIILFGTNFSYGPVGDTPKRSGVAYAQIEFPTDSGLGDLSLRGEVYAQAEQFFSNAADSIAPGTSLPSYELYNARLSWNRILGSKLSAALWGRNLSDEEYFVGGMTLAAALGHNAAAVGEPRTYGLELSYRY